MTVMVLAAPESGILSTKISSSHLICANAAVVLVALPREVWQVLPATQPDVATQKHIKDLFVYLICPSVVAVLVASVSREVRQVLLASILCFLLPWRLLVSGIAVAIILQSNVQMGATCGNQALIGLATLRSA